MIKFEKEFFDIENTLCSGQVFRFFPDGDGFVLQSKDLACYLYNDERYVYIDSDDDEYFYNYFDLETDYSKPYELAQNFGNEFLKNASKTGKGIRILKQDKFEVFYSFLISQNNNIPRIKRAIESLSKLLGKKFTAFNKELYSFFTEDSLKGKDENFFKNLGLGYRSKYFAKNASIVSTKLLESFDNLKTERLRTKLCEFSGVGPKVADCISLFGYSRTDSFPVDTWIEKVYREEFSGRLTDRDKISKYFLDTFKEYSGIIQQYMFFYKRGK